MKKIIAIIILVLPWQLWASEKPEQLFKEANDYYQIGRYDSAIALYDSVIAKGYTSANLHYNLGNAHYRAEDVAPAIYHFEKALKLNPRMEDAKFNLRIANLKTVDKLEPPQRSLIGAWWRNMLRSFSADQWAIINTALLWIALILVSIYLFVNIRWIRIVSLIGSVAIFLLTIVVFLLNLEFSRIQNSTDEAIVFAPNIYVKSEPKEAATDLFIIHEGLKVHVVEQQGDWYQITLKDEKQGWIPADAVKVI